MIDVLVLYMNVGVSASHFSWFIEGILARIPDLQSYLL